MSRSVERIATPALPALPEDMREQLLQEQGEQIGPQTRLPRIKVLPAAGPFEFSDTLETTREFIGVVLNSHARNVLWDKPYGEEARSDEEKGPACSSRDGKFGVPKAGFVHASLGRAAQGNELIECASCPYNAWGSSHLIPANVTRGASSKGKAVTNQRSIYLAIEGRELPMELLISATSLRDFDKYLISLTNQSIPIQAVATRFKAVAEGVATRRYTIVKFDMAGPIDQATFEMVMKKRAQYMHSITPPPPLAAVEYDNEASEEEAPF